MVLCMHILSVWFWPSFAHYFKDLSAALDSKRTNFNSVWKSIPFNIRIILWSSIFLSHAILLPTYGHGSVMHMLSVWFWPSFAHYFKTFTTALGSLRTNLNSVWKSITFNVRIILWSSIFLSHAILLPRAGHGSVHAHPICMILTIFRPLF